MGGGRASTSAGQLRELIEFLEEQTGRPFDWDVLSESMSYIKRASELRLEAMDAVHGSAGTGDLLGLDREHRADQLPARQPGARGLLRGGEGRDRSTASRRDVRAVENERYRLYFDGIMNWNKLGWLASKFAEYDAAVVAGRYTHNVVLAGAAPDRRRRPDPGDGAALPALPDQPRLEDLQRADCCATAASTTIDGIVFHSTRTCRAFTNPQAMLARAAQTRAGHPDDRSSRATSRTRRSTRTRCSTAGSRRCSRPIDVQRAEVAGLAR